MPDQSKSLEPRRGKKVRLFAIAGLVLAGILLTYVATIHDFLAINRPVSGEVLVVESWFHNRLPPMQDAADAIRSRRYKEVICVAVDNPAERPPGTGSDAAEAVLRLTELGVDPALLKALPVANVDRDRTYSCAAAVRSLLESGPSPPASLDVFSVSVHARKSWLLYRKAMPPGMKVGILSGREAGFSPSRWWLSRRGIYVTIRNTLGYLYAVTFSPPLHHAEKKSP